MHGVSRFSCCYVAYTGAHMSTNVQPYLIVVPQIVSCLWCAPQATHHPTHHPIDHPMQTSLRRKTRLGAMTAAINRPTVMDLNWLKYCNIWSAMCLLYQWHYLPIRVSTYLQFQKGSKAWSISCREAEAIRIPFLGDMEELSALAAGELFAVRRHFWPPVGCCLTSMVTTCQYPAANAHDRPLHCSLLRRIQPHVGKIATIMQFLRQLVLTKRID
jgi:hypothetical protein